MRTDYLDNKRPGPLGMPSRRTRSPRSRNDIRVGEYYYGYDCPACKKTTPIVRRINDAMIGAHLDAYPVDREQDVRRVRVRDIGQKFNPHARGTFGKGAIEATPTFIWRDGLRTRGFASTPEGEFGELETAEYLAIRAGVCYAKVTHPEASDDQLRQTVIEDFFQSRLGMREHTDGEMRHDPYQALTEVTKQL